MHLRMIGKRVDGEALPATLQATLRISGITTYVAEYSLVSYTRRDAEVLSRLGQGMPQSAG